MATEDKDEPFRFPATYPLKVMGRNTNEFYSVVSAIVEKHVAGGGEVTYSSKTSSGDKYISITATFSAKAGSSSTRSTKSLPKATFRPDGPVNPAYSL